MYLYNSYICKLLFDTSMLKEIFSDEKSLQMMDSIWESLLINIIKNVFTSVHITISFLISDLKVILVRNVTYNEIHFQLVETTRDNWIKEDNQRLKHFQPENIVMEYRFSGMMIL